MQRFFAALLLIVTAVAGRAMADVTTSQVLDALKRTEGLVKSASGTTVVVTCDRGLKVSGATSSEPINKTRKYAWMFQGSEWRHEVCATGESSTGPCVQEGYCSGNWILYDPKTKAMQVYGPACRGRIGILPLWAQYVGVAFSLDDRFARTSSKIAASNAAVIGEESVAGSTAITLQGISPQGETVKWWLCPAYGYMPVKVEERSVCTSGECKETMVVTTYGDYTEVAEGVWLPKTSSVIKTVTENDGSVSEDLRIEAKSEFNAVNVVFANDQLRISPAAGATVVYTESIKTAQ